MIKRLAAAFMLTSAAAASAACLDFSTRTSPTPTANSVLGGNWATTQSLPGVSGSLADSCVNFQWAVTSFTGTSGSGTFSATCLGNMQVSGSATGTLSGTTLTWSANATATVPGVPSCAIAISGTATLEANNQIRIPYAGTTCLGPVSGTEIIKR
ncbi:MAG TPA: hypothetical protein VFV78_00370 [Vicinamibacterales bacterium]|nr:hypothetical protein [Vicinamibacterales bacterium]